MKLLFRRYLYDKLDEQIFDAGNSFMLTPVEDSDDSHFNLKLVVSKEDGISKEGQ